MRPSLRLRTVLPVALAALSVASLGIALERKAAARRSHCARARKAGRVSGREVCLAQDLETHRVKRRAGRFDVVDVHGQGAAAELGRSRAAMSWARARFSSIT